ncbi:MAG TPA: c-type cytochrome [Chloroflexia bacterium]|nr:c-type cytochrome [Chloroflexia bacterium]
MRDKVILGVTLSIVLLLTLVIYGLIDANRSTTVQASKSEDDARRGKHLYAQYCIQCHGPLGEGCIGPALNRATWRPEFADGSNNPNWDPATYDLMKRTIVRGRPSNQPGQQMPAWSVQEGGPLNDAEIEQLITFIQIGDWGTTLEEATSATGLGEELPAFNGFDDKARVAEARELMLEKGCLNCHRLGKAGGVVGAELTDVGSRRTADWLRRWIKDPKSVPAAERGPNLWLVAPTATLPLPSGAAGQPRGTVEPTSTPNIYPMNRTYMPTIPMTDEELDLLVDYLSHARVSTP